MAAEVETIPLVHLQMVKEKNVIYAGQALHNPKEAAEFIRPLIQMADREYLIVCAVDMNVRPLLIEITSVGTLSSCLVEPREVFKSAILANAAFVMVFHNHPSGSVKPSREDLNVTKRLIESGELLGIPLLDHIIVSEDSYYSMKEAA